MEIITLSRQEWLDQYAGMAHETVFGEANENAIKNSLFDYAFLVLDKDNKTPIIYTTVKQTTSKSLFIEFGGSFPDYRGSLKVKPAFKKLCHFWQEAGADFISLSVKNKNVAMQKLALSVGFIPFGMNVTDKDVFIDYSLVKEGT